MSIEENEALLELLNHQLIVKSGRIGKIPFMFIRNFFWVRLTKLQQKRNQVFRELREQTREKYPERFSPHG